MLKIYNIIQVCSYSSSNTPENNNLPSDSADQPLNSPAQNSPSQNSAAPAQGSPGSIKSDSTDMFSDVDTLVERYKDNPEGLEEYRKAKQSEIDSKRDADQMSNSPDSNFSEVDERADIIDEQHEHESSRLKERIELVKELIVDYEEKSPSNNSEEEGSSANNSEDKMEESSVNNPEEEGSCGNNSEYKTGDIPPIASSSSTKRKFEQDEGSDAKPSKSIKQDSSDITSDTEPFDFCGGDD